MSLIYMDIHVPGIPGYTWSLLTTVVEKRLSYSVASLPWPFLVVDFEIRGNVWR